MMQTETDEQSRLCGGCNKAFPLKIDFEDHLCIHTRECPSVCENELKHFEKMRSEINFQKYYHCCFCDKSFSSCESLKDHENIHSEEKPHSCTQCDFRSSSHYSLRQHILAHHTENSEHICSICSKGFAEMLDLQNHIQNTHSNEESQEGFCIKEEIVEVEETEKEPEEMHCCKHCSYTTDSQPNLLRHLWSHSTKKPYRCKICSKCYTQASRFKAHLRSHSAEPTYACSICGEGFFSKTSVRTHEKTHEKKKTRRNSAKKLHRCEYCEDVFCSETRFVYHMLEHVKDTFPCSICGTRFATREKLEHHEARFHSGAAAETMLRCPVCPYSASRVRSLNTHLQTHPDELGRCMFCGKVFSNMIEHLESCKDKPTALCSNREKYASTETEVKDQIDYPFSCNICGDGFQSESVLEAHKSCLHSKLPGRLPKMEIQDI